MGRPSKILQAVKKQVHAVAYGNPLYQMVLDRGASTDQVRFLVPDPWPGNVAAGLALITEQAELFSAAQQRSLQALSTENLRDLRAVGTDAARAKALEFLEEDIQTLSVWRDDLWEPDVLAERLSSWVSFYDFYATVASPDFFDRLIPSLTRQFRHLLHLQPVHLAGLAGLQVVKGLVIAGLALSEKEKALPIALDLLLRQIDREILPDGGHVSRNPSLQLHMLRLLIDIRMAFQATQIDPPFELKTAISKMLPVLKFFRHGDGRLALFNGAQEESELWIDAAHTLAEERVRLLRRLPDMGYERITAGRSLLLIDVGAPSPKPHDRTAHAGLLGFEFSAGRERLIVNCGAMRVQDGEEWFPALAATAAHSTVTLCDTNACEIFPDGGVGHRPKQVVSQRYEQDTIQFVDVGHDGYAAKLGALHQRRLGLSADGEELQGQDVLTGCAGREFVVRWHVHPSVRVSLAQDGMTALLRTPSGSGWRLRAMGGDLGLESSIYCGDGKPRRAMQIKLYGHTSAGTTIVGWTLAREKRL